MSVITPNAAFGGTINEERNDMNKRNICTEGWTAGLGVRASWALLREGWKSKDDV